MAQGTPGLATTTHVLAPVEEVRKRRKHRSNVNEKHEESLSVLERLAVWITAHIGTMGFFIFIFCWTAIWLSWNYLAHRNGWPGAFDKPFEFAIWLFISNLIQLMLLPLIMLGQNLQSRHAELRADQTFQATEQTEYEMEVALRYLETIHHKVSALDQRLEALERKNGPAPVEGTPA